MERILIMEDDVSIERELRQLLTTNGYLVVDRPPCTLALLDVNLPDKSGYEICRELRKNSDIPVIFLTARNSAEDELVGFGVGADDYIRKPYDSAVLLARIARLLKRKNTTQCVVRGLSLDLANMKMLYQGQEAVLTRNEARILYCMMQKELCSKEDLIEDLWNNSLYIDENTLYVNINRLRDKMRLLGADSFIQTVRGVGYRL